MTKLLFPLLTLVFVSGCGTPPAPKVGSAEVIGGEIDTSMVTMGSKPGASIKPAAPAVTLKVWTVDEVTAWYASYVKVEKGDSVGLQYQGSDPSYHFFIARIPSTRGWMKIAVSKSELKLEKELPDHSALEPPRGYGFVDPYKGFRFLPRVASP